MHNSEEKTCEKRFSVPEPTTTACEMCGSVHNLARVYTTNVQLIDPAAYKETSMRLLHVRILCSDCILPAKTKHS